MNSTKLPLVLLIALLLFSCNRSTGQSNAPPDLSDTIDRHAREAFVEDYWRFIFEQAGLPDRFARSIIISVLDSPEFVMELLGILEGDPYLYLLVDKQNPLPMDYEPDDLIALTAGGSFRITRNDLTLRTIPARSLEEMARAARADGVVLTVGSAYRSGPRQAEIYDWNVRTYGQEAADRHSARPGMSQHQLGLVVDFSPIEDSFAQTPASAWLVENASRFGWSLSYPDGYEHVTGYRWESWHYRYMGRDITSFIDNYFDGIQQYALQFIQVWQQQ
ncbi:MAG: M15 family metallopeptidase [Treponema sp.]|nr:M15 family metallopeptidase [Treponema sp.]